MPDISGVTFTFIQFSSMRFFFLFLSALYVRRFFLQLHSIRSKLTTGILRISRTRYLLRDLSTYSPFIFVCGHHPRVDLFRRKLKIKGAE